MDVCPAFDSHNDLPWTYIKYQDGNEPTKTNIGIEMDRPISNLYTDQILNKTITDSHTSKFGIHVVGKGSWENKKLESFKLKSQELKSFCSSWKEPSEVEKIRAKLNSSFPTPSIVSKFI